MEVIKIPNWNVAAYLSLSKEDNENIVNQLEDYYIIKD